MYVVTVCVCIQSNSEYDLSKIPMQRWYKLTTKKYWSGKGIGSPKIIAVLFNISVPTGSLDAHIRVVQVLLQAFSWR